MNFLQLSQQILTQEIAALELLAARLNGEHLEKFIQTMYQCAGKIVVCGIGKSGLIGQKIAATLSSTGTPSIFLQAAEALHGDLGILTPQDVFLSISNSGETDEILQLIPFIKSLKIPHLSLVGNENSTLAKNADYFIHIGVENEISPVQAVPMASCLTTLAAGDILATALIHLKKFNEKDFSRLHIGGSLGRKLLTKVADAMQTQPLPVCDRNDFIKDILIHISRSQLGLVAVLDGENLLGIVTDGDLRRALNDYENANFFQLQAHNLMNPNPKTIAATASLSEAENQLISLKINALLVVNNENKLVGAIAKHHIK